MKHNLLCATAICAVTFSAASAQQFPALKVKTAPAGDLSNMAADTLWVGNNFVSNAGDASNTTVIPFSAPLPITPSLFFGLTLYPQMYGYRGDGNTHPLSEIYSSLPPTSITGSILCPEATSLTQTQDWCATQTAIDYIVAHSAVSFLGLGVNGYKIHFPGTGACAQFGTSTLVVGPISVNGTIMGAPSITLEGDGELQSQLCHTAPTDFLDYGLNPTNPTAYTGSLKLRDFAVYQKSGVGGVAFNMRFSQTHPTLDADMVQIGLVSTGNAFATGFLCNGCDDSVIQHNSNRCEVSTVGDTNPPAGSGCLCDALRHPVVSDCGHRDWDVVISGS